MTDLVFVDSNVLIYSRDDDEPAKRVVAHTWLDALWASASGRIGAQVLNETYWNVTHKFRVPLSSDEARAFVHRFLAWAPVPVDAGLIEAAWRIEGVFQLAWWDALIVAAAQRADCGFLLSEDLQDGRRFGDALVVDPFRHSPDEVLGGGADVVSEPPPRRRRSRRRV